MALASSTPSRIYYINTFNKESGTSEYFSHVVRIPQSAKYDRVVLLQASIPVTFYLIQDGFNTFTLREAGVDSTITVPPGNYSATAFATVVSALLTAASPSGWTYSITRPNAITEAATGKFTYTVTGNDSQPAIICTDNVNEQLGFLEDSTNTFVGGTLTSTRTIDFAPESTLFIHSDIAVSAETDVLQEIYSANSVNMSRISYQCTAPELYSKVLRTDKSNLFTFSLTNERGRLMNLNGVDMELTICLYKSDDNPDLVRRYMHYKLEKDGIVQDQQ